MHGAQTPVIMPLSSSRVDCSGSASRLLGRRGYRPDAGCAGRPAVNVVLALPIGSSPNRLVPPAGGAELAIPRARDLKRRLDPTAGQGTGRRRRRRGRRPGDTGDVTLGLWPHVDGGVWRQTALIQRRSPVVQHLFRVRSLQFVRRDGARPVPRAPHRGVMSWHRVSEDVTGIRQEYDRDVAGTCMWAY